jgi:hypothetical protein
MLLTEDIADAMYDAILEYGVTDSRAGLMAHVSTSTVSRWKQEDPIFADFLETARTAFEAEEVRKIRTARRRDGQFSPQNSKWLLERTNPARWGRPSTRSTPAHTVRPENRNPNSQQRNFTQNIPEIPEPHASHPPRSDSQSIDSETAANLAQNQTSHAAATADIAVPPGAQFHSTQQSKFPPNIPEIRQPKPERAAAFVTQDHGPAALATQIVPAKPVGVTPSSCGNYPPALAVKGMEEFLARFSSRRAA